MNEFLNVFVGAKGTSYTVVYVVIWYLRIITLFRDKIMEAAGWVKKCVEEPSSEVFSASR